MHMTHVWYSNVLTSELDVTPSVVEISGTTASSLKKGQNLRKVSVAIYTYDSLASYEIPVHAVFVPKIFFNIHDVGT